MSDQESKNVSKDLPPAPSDVGDISLSGFHKHEFCFDVDTAKDFEKKGLVRVVLKNFLVGMGRVELEKVQVRYTTSKSGDYVYAGFANALFNQSAKTICRMPGNFYVVSNSMNTGVQHEKDLFISGLFSKQLQPVSSQLPDAQFAIGAAQGVSLMVVFHVIVHGPIVSYHPSSEWGN